MIIIVRTALFPDISYLVMAYARGTPIKVAVKVVIIDTTKLFFKVL